MFQISLLGLIGFQVSVLVLCPRFLLGLLSQVSILSEIVLSL